MEESMANITETSTIIDEFERRLERYGERNTWQKASFEDWNPWLLTEGPKIIQAWREIAFLIKSISSEELLRAQEKWAQALDFNKDSELMQLAAKFARKMPKETE
jgi:hypothetical protein